MKSYRKIAVITGGVRRIGQLLAFTLAEQGFNLVLHYSRHTAETDKTIEVCENLGAQVVPVQADFHFPEETSKVFEASKLFEEPAQVLINNAAIFEPVKFMETSLEDWQSHQNINLTAPFLLTQLFARQLPEDREGRIVNILDWRALRPGKDHFPYTISKAGLSALTKASALVLAPRISVNGIAFGAILPPSDNLEQSDNLLKYVPAGRWADLDEVSQIVMFLINGPSYITGEIIHLDGGRHLV